jgi:hypothetical protein
MWGFPWLSTHVESADEFYQAQGKYHGNGQEL